MLNEGVNVRLATLDDRQNIDAVLSASYNLSFPKFYDASVLDIALPVMVKSQPKLIQSQKFYVAENERSQIIACGGWSLEQPGTGIIIPLTAHIRQFATHPDFTKRGAAGKIFEKCVEMAKVESLNRLECFSSLCAVGFYERVGMRSEKETKIKMGENTQLSVVIMRMDI